MSGFNETANAFVQMAHEIVWCTVATIDKKGRPRSRVLHPIWELKGDDLVGWIATGPTPVKKAHLGVSAYVSCNYWTKNQDTCAAECHASWVEDPEGKQNIWDKYRNVLGIWMYYLLNNEPITIFGDGTQRRAFSYIDDSVEPLFNAHLEPKASKQIINLGGIEDYSILHCAKVLQEVVGKGEIVHLEKRHEVHTAVPTFQKSIDILGFEYKTSLKEGLTKMWDWAQKQPMRERFIWENYEIEKGIYSFWKK